jgi:pyridoxine kinase
VIGEYGHCYVKPEVLEFFKKNLKADIITPNQYEAEVLSGIKIDKAEDLKTVATYFHNIGVKIVIITGIKMDNENELNIFVSEKKSPSFLIKTKKHFSDIPINGTGDLFSSVFLGMYLKTKDVLLSAQSAVFFLELAIKNTIDSGERELQVLSV